MSPQLTRFVIDVDTCRIGSATVNTTLTAVLPFVGTLATVTLQEPAATTGVANKVTPCHGRNQSRATRHVLDEVVVREAVPPLFVSVIV